MTLKPKHYLTLYVLLIFLYSLAYYFFRDEIKVGGIVGVGYLESLYFSSITITTLGYGDIVPVSINTMCIAASEAVFGIVIIGLFLSSLWQSFANKIEEKQSTVIRQRMLEQNLSKILNFHGYFKSVIAGYELSLAELTTPINKRSSATPFKFNENFEFSDFQDILGPSLIMKNNINKSVVFPFYYNLELLCFEIRFILTTLDLNEHPEIHARLIEFLSFHNATNIKEGVIAMIEMASNDQDFKNMIVDLIKNANPDDYKKIASVISPVIILNSVLKKQYKLVKEIEKNFDELKPGS